MSAFAVVYERSNMPGNLGVFNKIMERLSHRGLDGYDSDSSGNIAMGHWHFWVTPEEVGERQPLSLDGLPFRIVLDGRIDNREELFSKLDITSSAGRSLSDAALILRAYAHWGEDCFTRFVGEFALVIFDKPKNQIVCARDHLGDRTLFYAFYGSQVVIASEPWAVTAASGTKPELNENMAAHYFALRVPENGETFFNNVYELQPAHTLKITPQGQYSQHYWQPDLDKKTRYKTEEEYAEHFRTLLEEAVRSQMRSATPVGVLMSGGLDSTSVASLAARMIAPQQLTTISYIFDEFPECDERRYINTVKEKWNLNSIQIPCDHELPYNDLHSYTPNPNEPNENPYRLVHERAFTRAHDEGLRVILNGSFGDHLYVANREWLADLLMDGHFGTAWQEVNAQIRSKGFQKFIQARYLHRIARRMLDAIGGKNIYQRSANPHWLTQYSNEFLPKAVRLAPALERNATLLGLMAAYYNSHFFFKSSKYGLELRSPFRDRRLIEYVTSLPAYQIYHRGMQKYILRQALKGILPEEISTRVQPTSLLSFFYRGVDQHKNTLQPYAQDAEAGWRKFVKAEWLLNRWDTKVPPEQDGPEVLIFWLCVSYEIWNKSFSAN